MRTTSILLGYLKWHYGKALISVTRVWGNFLYFVREFFSLRLLVRNLFDPWKRMDDAYPKNFDLKQYFTAFLTNAIVRVFGFFMRAALIIIGTLVYILTAVIYPLAMIGWAILPLIILALFIAGIILIIK